MLAGTPDSRPVPEPDIRTRRERLPRAGRAPVPGVQPGPFGPLIYPNGLGGRPFAGGQPPPALVSGGRARQSGPVSFCTRIRVVLNVGTERPGPFGEK
jgi:hypothetical protein